MSEVAAGGICLAVGLGVFLALRAPAADPVPFNRVLFAGGGLVGLIVGIVSGTAAAVPAFAGFVVAAWIDWRFGRMPWWLTSPTVVAVLVAAAGELALGAVSSGVAVEAGAAAVVVGGIFFVLGLLGMMGGADAVVAAPLVWVAVTGSGSVLAAPGMVVVAVVVTVVGAGSARRRGLEPPFGPGLVVGAAAVSVWGPTVFDLWS